MSKMSFRTLFIVLLSAVVCFASDAENKYSCGEYELGPVTDLKITVDKLLHINWKPPAYYESCQMKYKVRIQNIDNTVLLIPDQELTGLYFTFDYVKDNHICINIIVIVVAYYDGMVSSEAWNSATLYPLVELGAPNTLSIENTQEYLNLKWTPAEGYETCANFMYFLTVYFKDEGGYIIAIRWRELEYKLKYGSHNAAHYCKKVIVEVENSLPALSGHSIAKSLIFGPPGHC